MRIALPVNDSHLSAVLDFSKKLLVVDIEDKRITGKLDVDVNTSFPPSYAATLRNLNVNTVICGAVSDSFSAAIYHSNIELIAGISGRAKQVITAYLNGNLLDPQFALPGFSHKKPQRKE